MEKLLNKMKSPVFWTEFVLLTAQALKLFGIYEVSSELLNNIQDIITVGFTVFATLNNPDVKDKF